MATKKTPAAAPKPDMAFSVAKRRTKPVTFTIGGEPEDDYVYEFTAPKMAAYTIDAILGDEPITEQDEVRRIFDWLGDGLRQGESERIIARLRDKDDDLEVKDVHDVMRWLQEKTAGRPTG